MKHLPFQRMLKVIEKLCYSFQASAEDLKAAKNCLDSIYRISHLANSDCPHKDWLKEFYTLENQLKDI